MKKKVLFRGIATALLTPFRDDHIDLPAFDLLLEEQISAGIDALVIGGTTGEAATLSTRERYLLYRHAADRVAGRCPLIFGTGTNDTKVAVKHTKMAKALGADGVLTVTPYYNKGTEAGLVTHYLKVAEDADLPMLLYNVPSRTGVNLTLEQLRILAGHENVAGIKEASDSLERLVSLSEFGESLPLYAGNDTALYTVLALGGLGGISVVSGVLPEETVALSNLFFEGRQRESAKKQRALLPMIRALFIETNPSPIKYALSLLHKCRSDVRLPLSPPNEESAAKIRRALEKYRTVTPALG